MKKVSLFFAAFAFMGVCRAATFQVTVQNNQFQPQNLSVVVGDVVTWNFMEGGHTTTSGNSSTCTKDDKWDSGLKGMGESFSHTFTATGEYPYFCTSHCPSMFGAILVGPLGVSENNTATKTRLENFPNPFVINTSFRFYAEKPAKGLLEIFTMEGKKMTAVNVYAVTGQNIIPFTVAIPEGTYIARLTLEATLPDYRIITRQK
jgi:plastocyanin